MPIRLNLLAEAQAAEEIRRRDPVKRAIWLGSLLVAGMLMWSGFIYLQSLKVKRDLARVEKDIALRTDDYNQVLKHQAQTAEVKARLAALRQFTTIRFLHGTLLDAVQQVTLPEVQLTRLLVAQQSSLTPETKGKTNSEGRVIGYKPASAKEAITVTLEARDTSPNPGDQVNNYRDVLGTNAYFSARLSRTNAVRLAYVSPPVIQPDIRPFVLFTIECRFPEVTR